MAYVGEVVGTRHPSTTISPTSASIHASLGKLTPDHIVASPQRLGSKELEKAVETHRDDDRRKETDVFT